MQACTSCGTHSENLLEIFPGQRVRERLPFCADCVAMGACELPFMSKRELDARAVVRSVLRMNRFVLDELRASGSQISILQARVDALEKALLIDQEL